ncbi:matrix-remodeling-associated protein 5-like [Pocillopora verrucosa]|uniref:matrix-remodeling-associated protein 5-like n=1 Tax=Pocillopora verrucosa TaxID=203993 RepID=UPI003341CAAF
MVASQNIIWRKYKFSVVCIIFIWTFLSLSCRGVDALKFLNPPPQVSSGYLARNIDFNCSTDDANATVKLFFAADFVNYNERTLSPKKLHLNKQVFTLLNLGVRDGGQYRCKATDGKKTIEWPSTHGLLFLSQGKLPDIILDPPRPIIIQQGQTGKITCQAFGWSVSKLAWKKRTDSGDQNVPDSKVTNVVDKSENLVKATLTFTNAQRQDSGEYKCVLTAFNKQDYKLANIRVDGVDALKFLSPPPQVSSGYLARNIDFNCSTDDANATVKLFFAADFVNFNERTLSPEKLHLNKQVFTLLNLGVRDGGQYRCKATDGKKTIEWPSTHGLLFLSQGKLPDIVLDPPRPIIIQQGQTGKITCQAFGWSVSKLAWKKRSNSGDKTVPDSKVTNVVDKSENLVKATLTFTNAQRQDSGEYKCVLTAFNKQDYKLANIRVDGVDPLKFLNPPPQVSSGYLARNIDFNCSTNDANAIVKLFFAADFVNYNERTLSPEKLHLNKQVFTLLNLGVKDGGQYRCKATDGKETIEWPSTHGLLFLSQGKLPDIILDPPRPIIVQQGQTGTITCQARGWSVSKLAWKKRSDSVDKTVPDSKVTNVIDKSENLVKATLTFTNAQRQDSGEYKCVLTAFNKQNYKLANIRVDGKL